MMSFCNDCNGKKNNEAVGNKVDTIRSFLLQMSTLNDSEYVEKFRGNSYRLDKTASETKATRFWVCIETQQEKLYWYDQYSAILTSSNAFIFPCALSDGNIGVMIWRTRCTKPVNHLLVYDVKTKKCHLVKRAWFYLSCDITVDFDREEVLE